VLESTALRSAIFGSLYGQVAAIDRDGVIIAVNHSWTRFAEERPRSRARRDGRRQLPGRLPSGRRGPRRRRALALEAITDVLTGKRPDARLEYAFRSQSSRALVRDDGRALPAPRRGAVISYIDITRRWQAKTRRAGSARSWPTPARHDTRRAQRLARSRDQPALAAIVTNAQAAIRLLDRDGVVHADVSEAPDDMAADAQRASAIIRRLRALSRKEHASSEVSI